MKKLAYTLALAIASNLTCAIAADKVAATTEKAAATVEKTVDKAAAPAKKAVEKVVAPADKAVDKAAAPADKAATTEAKSGVRKPTGNVGKFWDALNWDDLSADEKKLWGVLGWNGRLWGAETGAPASESAVWDKLSKEEQEAATALGYDKKSWNKEE